MKKLLYLASLVFIFSACSGDGLSDLTKDEKNPETVPYYSLMANATVTMFDYMNSCNVNNNNFRLWAQQWAQTTYPDESNYILNERNVNGRAWDRAYGTILRDLDEAKPLIDADAFLTSEEKANQQAIITIMEVLTYTHLVDVFGNVPYTEALGDSNSPAYDDAKSIYWDLMPKLNGAITTLAGSTGLGGNDLIYGGDAAAWRKLGNSLKLRIGIRVADHDNAMGQGMAESAVADGVFESSADNFTLNFSGQTPNTNPLWESLVQSGRSDFVAANTMVDILNDLNDPRRHTFYSAPYDDDGNPMGGVYGAANGYPLFSHAGTVLLDPTFPGTLLDYTEVAFLLADANERGYNVGGDAETWYGIGVTESIAYWGGGDAAAYLAQPDVAYATAPGNWKEKIGLQKWIAHYNQGFEAWTTWRMYDVPQMNVAEGAGTTPPFRYTYPITEISLNKANLEAAADAMGGDDLMTKVFWDMN